MQCMLFQREAAKKFLVARPIRLPPVFKLSGNIFFRIFFSSLKKSFFLVARPLPSVSLFSVSLWIKEVSLFFFFLSTKLHSCYRFHRYIRRGDILPVRLRVHRLRICLCLPTLQVGLYWLSHKLCTIVYDRGSSVSYCLSELVKFVRVTSITITVRFF